MSAQQVLVYIPSNLHPLHMKHLRLGMMDGGCVTFGHETKYIDIDICVNITFEGDFLALCNYLVQGNFDLYKFQHKKEHFLKNGSSSKCNHSAWYFLLENLWEKAGHGIGTCIEKVNDKTG